MIGPITQLHEQTIVQYWTHRVQQVKAKSAKSQVKKALSQHKVSLSVGSTANVGTYELHTHTIEQLGDTIIWFDDHALIHTIRVIVVMAPGLQSTHTR